MKVKFYKYQGTGNDFIMINHDEYKLDLTKADFYEKLCDRRFGIGADGVIFFQKSESPLDFRMIYFNSDGKESTMCGNGGRCIVNFAIDQGLIDKDEVTFSAIDGIHKAIRLKDKRVKLKMSDVKNIEPVKEDFFLDTGSPHYVRFVEEVGTVNVAKEGRRVRNFDQWKEAGVNVNFVENAGDVLKVRTYERGVENETYSCGTGVVAAALVAGLNEYQELNNFYFGIKTPGGELEVEFKKNSETEFSNIWLTGLAAFVFEGEFEF